MPRLKHSPNSFPSKHVEIPPNLEDKGGYLHDPVTGNNYARMENGGQTGMVKRRKYRHAKPETWERAFGLYCLYRQGKLTIHEVAYSIRKKPQQIHMKAYKNGWAEKADQINKRLPKETTMVDVARTIAQLTPKEETRENLSATIRELSRHLKKSPARRNLKNTQAIVNVVNAASKTDGWEKEDKPTVQAPAINIAFLTQSLPDIKIVR